MNTRKFLGMALFLSVGTCASAFAEVVDFKSVEPTGSMPVTHGWAYDSRRNQFKGACVTIDRNALYQSGSGKQNSVFKFVESTSEMAKDSNLSVNASLKVLGVTTYQASNKLSVISGTKTSTFNQSLYSTVYRYDRPLFADIGSIRIKEDKLALLNKPGGIGEFKQRCGDTFVIGVQEGREFLGVASVKKQSLESWTKFANKANASAKGPWGNAKVDMGIAKNMERSFGSSQISINTYSTGSTMLNPTNINELITYFKNFLSKDDEKKTIKYIVAPYSMLGDYPSADPFKADTKDAYLGTLIVSLWDLKAGIQDAKLVLSRSSQELFAMGTTRTVKNKRVNVIKQYKRAWEQEFDKLLKATQQCNKNFTNKCKTLAKYYERYRNYIDEWDALMPEKYLSNCKVPIVISDEGGKGLGVFKQPGEGGIIDKIQEQVLGDKEGGGGASKTRIVTIMNVKPDNRKLKATISLARLEWKRKQSKGHPIETRVNKGESAWALTATHTIFDLDNPFSYGVELDSNLTHCTYKKDGITTPKVTAPGATRSFHRFGFKARKFSVNGLIDDMTGRGPRGVSTFAGGKGTLDYIKCEADRKGKDDKLKCKEIGFHEIKLDLVSTQDLKANKWKAPKKASVPSQLNYFFVNKPIKLSKRVMRTYGKPSKTARKKLAERQKLIKNFGVYKIKLPKSQLKFIPMKTNKAPNNNLKGTQKNTQKGSQKYVPVNMKYYVPKQQ